MANLPKQLSFLQSLKSRKLILAVAGAVVALGNGLGWWNIDSNSLSHFEQSILAYIGVEGAADTVQRLKS